MDICFPDDVSLSSRVLLQFYSTLHHTEPFIDFSLLATVMIVEDVLRVKQGVSQPIRHRTVSHLRASTVLSGFPRGPVSGVK